MKIEYTILFLNSNIKEALNSLENPEQIKRIYVVERGIDEAECLSKLKERMEPIKAFRSWVWVLHKSEVLEQ